MKKLFLLIITGSIALTAGAQERQFSLVSTMQVQNTGKTFQLPAEMKLGNHGTTANKSTSGGGSRWYNYVPYVDTEAVIAGFAGVNITGVAMWSDSTQNGQFTSGLSHINLACVGTILDPSSIAFNDSNFYVGDMKVSSGDAYVVDSVEILGNYGFNPAKHAIKDTLRLSFVKGMGAASASDDIHSGYSMASGHFNGKTFLDLYYDSVSNYARSGTAYGTPSSNVQDIVLDSLEWADTSATGIWFNAIKLNTPLSVSAGGFAGMSMSFISGDHTIPTTLPGDTIFYSTGVNKYNNWEPIVAFVANTAGDVQWPTYNVADSNVGLFRQRYNPGWSDAFLPTWGWSSSSTSGAATYQYPEVLWHITCTTCGVITNTAAVKNVYTISKVNAYPNPAANELNIPFTLSQTANVTVSLSNMVGQVIAHQDMGNVSSGKAVINTASLPEGVYIYTVLANGERNTGRVVVSH